MSASEIYELLSTVPTWIWVVGLILLYVFFFGERILWDYEVKFPKKEGVGRGEVELECGKKKGSRVECSFELTEHYQNKSLEIYVQKQLLLTIPAERNNSATLRIKESVPLEEPSEGDVVGIRIDGVEVFSGALVLD